MRAPSASITCNGPFGLGWPEIGVIGVLVLLLGPDRLAPLAKDLGKQAAGLKEVLPDVTDAKDAACLLPRT